LLKPKSRFPGVFSSRSSRISGHPVRAVVYIDMKFWSTNQKMFFNNPISTRKRDWMGCYK